ncbi:diguanylate cyclase [Photobacterium profundum]|uniref:TackOD1 domain-containing metal-binding protein n=1 Tax=Photobacterium profundum TaxID=74109 RepID=UPI003D0CBDD7
MKSQPDIYVFGAYNEVVTPEQCAVIPARCIDDLPSNTSGVIIIGLNNDAQDALLMQLHSSKQFGLWQIFVQQPTVLSSHLSDGLWSAVHELEQWHYHQQRLAMITGTAFDPMIAWLWLNPERRLLAKPQSDLSLLYRYPLLECYYSNSEAPYGYLQSQVSKGYLQPDKLIDKIRQCPACHSGHLNYLETCPACFSPDIEERISLHCFTCGHVSAQDNFIRRGQLECPNCLTQIRHIGVDYDRPLETFHCNGCKHAFVEATTKVRCLDCLTLNDINILIPRKIYTYQLGIQATHTIRYGQALAVPELTLNGKVDVGYFHSLLVWINKLAQRHQQSHLILGMHLPGLKDYAYRYGEVQMFSLTEQISERLNGLMRDTDICCQYRPDLMLLLMPMTSNSSLPVLQNKIVQLADVIEESEFSLEIYAWSLPDSSLNDDAPFWLQQCLQELNDNG